LVKFRILSFDVHAKGYERGKLFNEIYGYSRKTSVKKYFYPGLLHGMPWVRLGMSVIAVPRESSFAVEEFLRKAEKEKKLTLYAFDTELPSDLRDRAMENYLGSLNILREMERAEEIAKKGRVPKKMIKELKLLIKEAKKVDVSDKKHITKALQKRLGAIKGGRISVITSRLKRQREK
jgi:hypothetical protein